MKLDAGKRVLMFFHWLLSVLVCLAFIAKAFDWAFATALYNGMAEKLGERMTIVLDVAALTVYIVVTIAQASLIFRRSRRIERGFIMVDSRGTGRVRVAVSTIEQMARQAVCNIDGLADMRISIENFEDAIGINVSAIVMSGSHVPTLTMQMQHAIRQYVEVNSGVVVRSVSVNISNMVSEPAFFRRWRKRGAEPPQLVSPAYPETASSAEAAQAVPMGADVYTPNVAAQTPQGQNASEPLEHMPESQSSASSKSAFYDGEAGMSEPVGCEKDG